MSKGGIFIS